MVSDQGLTWARVSPWVVGDAAGVLGLTVVGYDIRRRACVRRDFLNGPVDADVAAVAELDVEGQLLAVTRPHRRVVLLFVVELLHQLLRREGVGHLKYSTRIMGTVGQLQ